MKEVILKVPDNKFKFFLELVKQLGYVQVSEPEISEEQKNAVRERISKSKQDPDRLIDWDKAKNNFKLD